MRQTRTESKKKKVVVKTLLTSGLTLSPRMSKQGQQQQRTQDSPNPARSKRNEEKSWRWSSRYTQKRKRQPSPACPTAPLVVPYSARCLRTTFTRRSGGKEAPSNDERNDEPTRGHVPLQSQEPSGRLPVLVPIPSHVVPASSDSSLTSHGRVGPLYI